ncbi:MAG: hypothetical protein ACPIOQ_77565, partial [Promethearchaeia archaeon]
ILSTDKDLTIFNECIKDLAAGCEGAHGYGTDAIMAMLILTRADAQQSCTVLAPTDQALCGEEFEAIMKIYRPRRRVGQKPDPARQSMWLGFMLNHIVGDYCSREDLSQASLVSALSGDQIQVSLLRALAAKSRESAQDASSAGVEGPASGKGTYGKTDYDTLRAWEQGQQIQAPWAFEEVRASNGIIYKIDRILTPGKTSNVEISTAQHLKYVSSAAMCVFRSPSAQSAFVNTEGACSTKDVCFACPSLGHASPLFKAQCQ